MLFQPSRLNPLSALRTHQASADIPMTSVDKGGWPEHDGIDTQPHQPRPAQQPVPQPSWLAAHARPMRMGLAAVVGAAITAGTTYAVAHHVQHLVSTAHVSADPAVWSHLAQTSIYDPCYLGCNDCDDIDYAYNACQRTAALNLTGIVCDGNTMWNWLERYPAPCLEALGNMLKASALESAKQHGRNQLGLIVLTVLAGVVGGAAIYTLSSCAASRLDARRSQLPERPLNEI